MLTTGGSLASCTELQDVLERAEEAARSHQGLRVLPDARPDGWREARWPTRAELDAVTGDIPIVLRHFDHHSMMVNSAALRTAGIDEWTPQPSDGRIEDDGEGQPTGVLLEGACRLINDAIGFDRVRLADLFDLMVAEPFAEYHDMLAQPELGAVLNDLESYARANGVSRAALPRFVLYAPIERVARDAEIAADWQSKHVRFAGGKIFVDGTLGSRTAWMLARFADGHPEHPAGMALRSIEQIAHDIETCVGLGLQLACHAIGDGAVRAVLDAVERVRPPRWTVRIEHAELIHPDDVPRFAELGVIASVQPCHLLVDIEALGRAIPDRLDRVLPLRSLIDAGLEPGRSLVFGSDAPIVRPDPEDSIRAAVHRSRGDSVAIAPEQAVSEAEAWACFDADRRMPDIGGD